MNKDKSPTPAVCAEGPGQSSQHCGHRVQQALSSSHPRPEAQKDSTDYLKRNFLTKDISCFIRALWPNSSPGGPMILGASSAVSMRLSTLQGPNPWTSATHRDHLTIFPLLVGLCTLKGLTVSSKQGWRQQAVFPLQQKRLTMPLRSGSGHLRAQQGVLARSAAGTGQQAVWWRQAGERDTWNRTLETGTATQQGGGHLPETAEYP